MENEFKIEFQFISRSKKLRAKENRFRRCRSVNDFDTSINAEEQNKKNENPLRDLQEAQNFCLFPQQGNRFPGEDNAYPLYKETAKHNIYSFNKEEVETDYKRIGTTFSNDKRKGVKMGVSAFSNARQEVSKSLEAINLSLGELERISIHSNSSECSTSIPSTPRSERILEAFVLGMT